MIYLIHFDKPFHHANHYLGFVESNLEQRIKKHKGGYGSKLMAALKRAGIGWSVVRIWETGDRNFERKLKGHSNTPYCPICNPKGALKRGIQPKIEEYTGPF